MAIPSLIDKTDNYELIRDQIAAILALESASQQALAVVESMDPDDYKLRVYLERASFEPWLNSQTDKSPIINVRYGGSTYQKGSSDIVNRQMVESTYHIDCFGVGVSKETVTGHMPGDELAAFESHRAARLVRNILMASEYTFLGMRGLVHQRWLQSLQANQIQFNSNNALNLVVTQLTLIVLHNEFSPQAIPKTLNYVAIDFQRDLDGAVIAEADFDYS